MAGFRDFGYNFRSPRVDVHQFAMIPRANIPRSTFRMQSQHKTTFSASLLVPVYLQEVLPGDSFNVTMSCFARTATPVYPIMDTLELESFFFFVPNRLVWLHWFEFMGQEDTPGGSISFTIPQVVSPASGFAQFSIYDYMGLPCVGQTAGGNTISVSALPFRSYALIYNEWFRDENLITPQGVGSGAGGGIAGGVGMTRMDDGPDPSTNYSLGITCKRHDYFTSCLPWTQKGAAGAITLPLGTVAPVRGLGWNVSAGSIATQTSGSVYEYNNAGGSSASYPNYMPLTGAAGTSANLYVKMQNASGTTNAPLVYADLSTATAATINSIRLAFQTQKLLERDARGGTRYTEIVRSHFGVTSPDARLMRPEYLGGGKTPINITPVPSMVPSTLSGTSNPPQGTLAAVGTAVQRHGFRFSATEHGHILGLVTVRADQLYQQGIRKLWSRSTRYDFYWPVFACLGEQAVLNKEIFSDGSANDALTFGYQERWAEYRYHPSYTSGYFRSTNTTPLDAWHLGLKFAALPTLNATFIQDQTQNILVRCLAAGASANNQQILADFFFDQKVARPMPMYSVPGLLDHF